MEAAEPLDPRRHADDLRRTWQARVLAEARGRMMIAVPSILAHSYDEAVHVLLRIVEPPCWDAVRLSLKTPFLCSAATIDRRGLIVANAIMQDMAIPSRDVVVFFDTADFERELRRLADRVKLDDGDRIAFFKAAQRWIVADRRVDPMTDPRERDARRNTVH